MQLGKEVTIGLVLRCDAYGAFWDFAIEGLRHLVQLLEECGMGQQADPPQRSIHDNTSTL